MWSCSNYLKISFVAGSESNVTNYLDTHGVVANTWNDMKVVAIGGFIRLHINNAVKGKLHNTNRHYLNNKNCLHDFNYTNIAFYVTKCRRFKTSPPFHAKHVDKQSNCN